MYVSVGPSAAASDAEAAPSSASSTSALTRIVSPKSAAGSLIDHIGAVLQQRAQSSPTLSTASTESPEPLSPKIVKRPQPAELTLECETKPKKSKKEDEEVSDTDSSDRGAHDDAATTTDSISPVLIRPTAGPSSPDDTFCAVPGRLSLLSSTSKYKVTVGEIQRRLAHPENLNASILGGILRRAKSKNGGKELRDTLETMGLSLPAGRRKSATVTLLTSLVEGEALHLARDFTFLCETEFPAKELADQVVKQHKDEGKELQARREDLMGTMRILNEFLAVMSADRMPIVSPTSTQPYTNPLTNFTLSTHGFGTPTFIAVLNSMIKYIQGQLELIAELAPPVQLSQAPAPAPPPVPLPPTPSPVIPQIVVPQPHRPSDPSPILPSPNNFLLSVHPSLSFAALLQQELLRFAELRKSM